MPLPRLTHALFRWRLSWPTRFQRKAPRWADETAVHVDLKGPLETPAQIEAHVEVPNFNMTYGSAHLELARPLRADLHNDELTVASAQVRGTGANLTVAGRIPIHGAATGYSVSADGSLDLAVLQTLMPNVHSSGQINIHFSDQGTPSRPKMRGQLQLKNVALSTDAVPIGLEGVSGQVNVSGNRAEIANLSGTAGRRENFCERVCLLWPGNDLQSWLERAIRSHSLP